jgi:hypothetical protein
MGRQRTDIGPHTLRASHHSQELNPGNVYPRATKQPALSWCDTQQCRCREGHIAQCQHGSDEKKRTDSHPIRCSKKLIGRELMCL